MHPEEPDTPFSAAVVDLAGIRLRRGSSYRRGAGSNQGSLWRRPPTRAEIDSRPIGVGDRVYQAGRPHVVVSIGADGRVRTEPDTRPQPPEDPAARPPYPPRRWGR